MKLYSREKKIKNGIKQVASFLIKSQLWSNLKNHAIKGVGEPWSWHSTINPPKNNKNKTTPTNQANTYAKCEGNTNIKTAQTQAQNHCIDYNRWVATTLVALCVATLQQSRSVRVQITIKQLRAFQCYVALTPSNGLKSSQKIAFSRSFHPEVLVLR